MKMPLNNVINNKKNSLLEKKKMILKEIKYYNQRIKEARCELSKPRSLEDYASSDSDNEFLVLKPKCPSAAQLTHKQKMLTTSLQATEELTGVEVLQAEVNVMVNEPELDLQSRINEPGIWREVAAECQMDQINFSIEFYAFKGDKKFAPTLYRGLRLTPAKLAQEKELSTSVLPVTKNPSDALEVLRNYSAAYRSRRFTLARLADKFGPALYMEPLAEGGYQLKCANVLEVSWMLQNKWSPVAPFQHKMKFDLENLEENYIKRIAQLYRQVSDPTVETDERTLLLASIISTCLEANPPQIESSMEEPSDVEMAKKDSEVMAPPKSAPKKTKPKTKENPKTIITGDQEAVKRSINEGDTIKSAKKLKTSEGSLENCNKTSQKQVNLNENENAVEPTKKRSKAVKRSTNDDNAINNAKKSKQNDVRLENKATEKQKNAIESENVTQEPRKSVKKSVNDETKKSKSSEARLDVNKATQKQKSPMEKNHVTEPPEKQTKNVPNTNDKVNKNAPTAKSNTEKVIKTNVASKPIEKSVKTNEKSDKTKANKTGKENKINEKGDSKSNENAAVKPTNDKKPKTGETAKTNDKKNINNAGKATASAITAKSQATTKNIADQPKEARNSKVTTEKVVTRRSLTNLNTVKAPIKTVTARNNEPKIAATTSKGSLKEVNVVKKPKNIENKIVTTNPANKVITTVKTITNDKGEVIKKVFKKLVNPNEGNSVKSAEKPAIINKNKINQPKFGVKKNNDPTSDKNTKKNVNGINKPLKENIVRNNNVKTTTAKSTVFQKPTTSTKSTISQKTGNTEKENTVTKIGSKIPQIRTSTPKKFLKKAPLRVSPRKPIPKPKSPLVSGKKVILKLVTNIPRLLNKPKPKVK